MFSPLLRILIARLMMNVVIGFSRSFSRVRPFFLTVNFLRRDQPIDPTPHTPFFDQAKGPGAQTPHHTYICARLFHAQL